MLYTEWDKYFISQIDPTNLSQPLLISDPIDKSTSLNIVSLSYNKHLVFYVKSNGECFVTNGDSDVLSKIKFVIKANTLAMPDNNFSLKSAYKLSGTLNKKYIIKVVCGEAHTVFLTHAGMVFSMGEGSAGQLGNGGTSSTAEPGMITSLLNYRVLDVVAGGCHNLAIAIVRDLSKKGSSSIVENKDHLILAWGDNSKGQLGLGDMNGTSTPIILDDFSHYTPQQKISGSPIKEIAAGCNHSLILFENGKVYGMGSNEYGEICHDDGSSTIQQQTVISRPVNVFNNVTPKDSVCCFIKTSAYSTFLATESKYCIIQGKIFPKEIKIIKLKMDINELNVIFNDDLVILLHNIISFDTVSLFENQTPPQEITSAHDEVKLLESDQLNNNNNNNLLNSIVIVQNPTTTTPQQGDEPLNESSSDEHYITKDFFSENLSTNEIIDDNMSFEQTIEELRSYISLVGISFPSYASENVNQNLSFRPKNLPRKTAEEEEYHRRLVEENRKRYIRTLKEKSEKEKKLKEKQDRKKERIRKLQETWELEILPNWFKKKKEESIKKYFYEGIPANLRGRVWLLCIGNNFSITPEYYEIEVKKAIQILLDVQVEKEDEVPGNTGRSSEKKFNIKVIDKEKSIKCIDLDIERTFPYLGIFKPNSPLSDDLREVLRAFVASRPDIGYVQGLSFIAGMLMLNMDKYQAFVALMNITLNTNIIPFYHFDEQQIRTRLQIFKQVFYYNLPELCDLFENLDILPEDYLIEWIMTLFSRNLNIDLAARIWDIYMIEGIKAIYQAAIVLLSHFEKKFMDMEYDEIMKTLKNLSQLNFDEDQLIESMKMVKFPDWVNQEIQKLNDEYIPIY